jgi:dTDP-4-dehydrorhamnose reductase
LNDAQITSSECRTLGLPARRPRYSALTSERGLLLSSLDDAIERYVAAVA